MNHNHAHGHSHGHSHGHDHHHHGLGGHNHHDSNRAGNKKGLTIALVITAGIMVLEFAGGLLTNSLALLSDSGHMLSDASSLALSLVAFWFAARPASPNKTYGFYRFEILAALFNGVTLFVIAGFIMREALHRFSSPPEVSSLSMILIATVGLIANLLSALALIRKGDVKNNLNLRSAYLHVLGDALGSVGAIAAGLLMLAFGWYIADPIISVLVSLLILRSAWGVIKHTVHILMEGTPMTVDQDAVISTLIRIEGVVDVHDLHIWTITSGLDSLSCHLLIEDKADHQAILQQAIKLIEDEFKIQHATIQIESPAIRHSELKV
ncbi:cation diffusion facilitator family transporter [Cohnella terricola]|uniref:Cation transporter n=1 Tax=Cohnella terricola TaxID=1289167 RepID=A0A559JTU9_9BACL|nr:cation diffusion facilitator family transporter [Cohnella terricola]TVY03277.1 cation transporter [Cohnella terricola]